MLLWGIITGSAILGLFFLALLILSYNFAFGSRPKPIDIVFDEPSTAQIPVGETTPPSKVKEALITNKIGMKLKLIPAGEFYMGAADGEPEASEDEKPQHKVRITRPFYLGVYEVTQAEYRAVMDTNPSYFSSEGEGKNEVAGKGTSRFPVEQVTWLDAIAFCNKLSEREALKPCYTETGGPLGSGTGYRLPTEAEWEYACRGVAEATTRKTPPFAFGVMLSPSDENFDWTGTYNGSAKGPQLQHTVLVGSSRPNTFGLYEMHGNLSEWCDDWYSNGYYAKSPLADPRNLTQAVYRVIRGGSWSHWPQNCRSAYRYKYAPDFRYYSLGFRVARVQSDP